MRTPKLAQRVSTRIESDILNERLYYRIHVKKGEVAYSWGNPDDYDKATEDNGSFVIPLPRSTRRWISAGDLRFRMTPWA